MNNRIYYNRSWENILQAEHGNFHKRLSPKYHMKLQNSINGSTHTHTHFYMYIYRCWERIRNLNNGNVGERLRQDLPLNLLKGKRVSKDGGRVILCLEIDRYMSKIAYQLHNYTAYL